MLAGFAASTLVAVSVPAVSTADPGTKCDQAAKVAPSDPSTPVPRCDEQRPQAQSRGLDCADGTVVDTKSGKCVSLTQGIAQQLKALPPPPALSGFGGAGGGGDLGGIPSLGTVNLPSVVLPSLGLGLVPDINVNLRPQFPSFNPLHLP